MVGKSDLAQGYEDLRNWAVGASAAGSVARGLALLLRRGMPAWMQAWLRHTPATAASHSARVHLPVARRATPGVGVELAQVLANMVLLGRGRLQP